METNRDVRASTIEALRKMPPADRDEGVIAKLWREIFPNTTYEEGYNQPFVICLTSFDSKLEFNVGSCLGVDADEVDIGLTEPTVKRRLKQAWLDLLAVNMEWLRLRPINIVEAIDEINRDPVHSSFAYLIHKRELSPEHPERAIKLLNFQLAYVRRAVRQAVKQLAVTNGDTGNLLQSLAQIAVDEKYGCLARYELMKLVQPAAFVLAQRHIRQMTLDYNQGRNEAKLAARMSEFVLSKAWDNVLSRDKRIEICALGLQGSNSEWAMKMKESLSKITEADEEEAGNQALP
ncbi:hypothetical protein ABKA04_001297 [Annulohypoxylon sp. FPYF3050]